MKKTVFEGIVNGTKYDKVEDYNKAVQAALEANENVEASSSTKIVVGPDPEEESCKKQIAYVPKQECKCNNGPELDFNFKSMMKKDPEELSEMLEQLEDNFGKLSDEYKENLMHLIKDTKVIAERQMKVTEKEIDNLDTQAAEIQQQIDELDEQYDKVVKAADDAEEVYDKLSMVVECLDGIIEDNKGIKYETLTMSELWKKLFNMPEIGIKD